ncbi:uncharacterized protein LOC127751506 [Frankliniella occidentalis]|uniref:Uncharacterized protein LOC127751506 n=1 Tax=Frankliniella occidentalis TaxID=133901 RepID=A0A9C6XTU6_FRAOC|nr:uncharacterized protein LOC127751506 [Frankliniella occidentalis]
MSSSPYKKMKTTNNDWTPYTQIRQLEKNKAYRILGIIHTNNDKYGPGECATLLHTNGKRYRTYLPKKYLSLLSKEDIQQIKNDVIQGKNIVLVFREVMNDNSYRIDLCEASENWLKCYDRDEEIPELEDSLTEEDATIANGDVPVNDENKLINEDEAKNKTPDNEENMKKDEANKNIESPNEEKRD